MGDGAIASAADHVANCDPNVPPAGILSPGATAPNLAAFDPADVELEVGHHRFRYDPLDTARRALLMLADGGVNGHPLDWVLTGDPCLDDVLVAVRRHPENKVAPAWFHRDQEYREETFHSPFSGRTWVPDTRLVRRLLDHVPAVYVMRLEERPHYVFDVRAAPDPRRLDPLLRKAPGRVLPASGEPGTEHGRMDALRVEVPFDGERYRRSTRKRFRLAVPGHASDASVEGTAARILRAHGFVVEQPRLVHALYRLLVAEPVTYWNRAPHKIESRGATAHHPPSANPLAALARGRSALHQVEAGEAPELVRDIGRSVVDAGRRPATYLHYIERLATLAERMGPAALSGCLEGMLRGHPATSADLLVMRPDGRDTFFVEVKSTGDRLRGPQMASCLWYARDGRCGYRMMKVDHPKAPDP